MEPDTNEPPPLTLELLLGLAYSSGFFSIIGSPFFGIVLPLIEGRDLDWTWRIALGASGFLALLVLGFVVVFGAAIVEWCVYGRLPNLFWSGRDHRPT